MRTDQDIARGIAFARQHAAYTSDEFNNNTLTSDILLWKCDAFEAGRNGQVPTWLAEFCQKAADTEAAERAEYERLKKKFGGDK